MEINIRSGDQQSQETLFRLSWQSIQHFLRPIYPTMSIALPGDQKKQTTVKHFLTGASKTLVSDLSLPPTVCGENIQQVSSSRTHLQQFLN